MPVIPVQIILLFRNHPLIFFIYIRSCILAYLPAAHVRHHLPPVEPYRADLAAPPAQKTVVRQLIKPRRIPDIDPVFLQKHTVLPANMAMHAFRRVCSPTPLFLHHPAPLSCNVSSKMLQAPSPLQPKSEQSRYT